MSSHIIGQVLDGKWQVLAQLGEGGMGTVFKARDVSLERMVAVKFLSSKFLENADLRARFEREAKVMAQLDHPNLVPVFAYGTWERLPYIVLKYVDGHTLPEVRRLGGRPFALREVVHLVSQLCDGLAHLHARDIVHRDLKPSNILVSEAGQLTLLDFGIARPIADASLTPQGSTIGTPHYMAPEQLLGRPLDGRSDLYSVGVLLFELATGTPVFEGVTDSELVTAHLQTPPPDPASRNAELSPQLARVLLKALAKQPDARFQNAESLKAALVDAAWPEDAHTAPDVPRFDLRSAPARATPLPVAAEVPGRITAVLPSEPKPFDDDATKPEPSLVRRWWERLRR